LVKLARLHGNLRWMNSAIASSAWKREKANPASLAADPGRSGPVLSDLAGVKAARKWCLSPSTRRRWID
jgi:hypothetical protein